MVEIAICLAIIGIALVAIIGVLPIGMRAQRENREKTIINQDATVFMNAIRNGARNADDLTNYVYAIVNTGTPLTGYTNALAGVMGFRKANYPAVTSWSLFLTNGANIVGLLSAPEFADASGAPLAYYAAGGISNHIIVVVRAMSGSAVDKPPQDNQILQQDSFSYRIFCANAPVAVDTNALGSVYGRQLAANLHELQLRFRWPQLPNGGLGSGDQAYRTQIAGQLAVSTNLGPMALYFYQPQSFTAASLATNAP